jgi:RNA polymerase sigma-70 factor (ECF subfamily)
MSGPSTENYIQFVRQHHAGLRAFVRSLGVLPMWVDDIAQEAFIVAYERLDEFDQSREFGAWVRGIARNLVINERRKDARRKRILADNLTDILVRTSSVPEDVEEELGDYGTAKLAALRDCMTQLPEKSRDLIRARYEQDEAAPDIADRLHMKPPAVRKALERVRESLKKCMDEKLRCFVEA